MVGVDFRALRAKLWRHKAEECRIVADNIQDPTAQATFQRLAESYDALAERLER